MLQPQQVLQNRYQLKSLLSKNAARQTWLATDLKRFENIENDVDNTDANNLENNQNAQVVVKLLAFGGDVEWEDLKLFEREAQILKQIQLERIPQYIDYFPWMIGYCGLRLWKNISLAILSNSY
ncbi:serine/threonine protein kinase [Calothrix sp. NIES-3974]|nr:serine/threonine protein kinase [Calothrix sp. NIES-3974]